MDGHRVWAEIDLDAIARNLSLVRERIDGLTRVLAVLKADAYGHGAIRVARRLVHEGVDMIGVGDSSEAIELRRAGITDTPILILGAVVAGEVPMIIAHDISVCVHSFDRARTLDEEARRRGARIRVHLKVDTGMGRLGVSPTIACDLAIWLQASAHLALEGVCTHLSSADERSGDFSRKQVLLFQKVLSELRAATIDPEYVHAANTAAVFNGASGPNPCFDLVRCGIGLYGVDPARFRGGEFLEPVLSLRSQIIFLKDHPARTPIGYNDGYPYSLGGRAWVLIRGQRAPVVGRITMDYTMVDVTKIRGVQVGDTVTLIGSDEGDQIRLTDVAEWASTIPYEIPCRLGRRVARVYSPLEAAPEPEPEPDEIRADPAPAPKPAGV